MSYAAVTCHKQLVSGEEFSVSDNDITASSSYAVPRTGPQRSRLNTISDAGGM